MKPCTCFWPGGTDTSVARVPEEQPPIMKPCTFFRPGGTDTSVAFRGRYRVPKEQTGCEKGSRGHQSIVYGLVGMVKCLQIGQWCKGDEQIAVSEAV